jgi:hypothetical protein
LVSPQRSQSNTAVCSREKLPQSRGVKRVTSCKLQIARRASGRVAPIMSDVFAAFVAFVAFATLATLASLATFAMSALSLRSMRAVRASRIYSLPFLMTLPHLMANFQSRRLHDARRKCVVAARGAIFTLFALCAASAIDVRAQICPFIVDASLPNAGVSNALLLTRYALNIRNAELTANTGSSMPPVTVQNTILANAARLDVNGDGAFDADDALIIARIQLGFSSDAWLTGTNITDAARDSAPVLARYVALGCPAANATQLSAAQSAIDAAIAGNTCNAIGDFYWEIGDARGLMLSGSVGTTVARTTELSIASASKWWFGAYVKERFSNVPLSASMVSGLHFTSGYSNFSFCSQMQTVAECHAAGNAYDAATDNHFYYGGGHDQKLGAIDLGLGAMRRNELTSEYARVLQPMLPEVTGFSFNSPQFAGGGRTSGATYAAFLRALLREKLALGRALDDGAVCTLPPTANNGSTCTTALNSPVPEPWDYAYNHWIEKPDGTNVEAYSSPGAFGFYPWLTASRNYYGVVARYSAGGGAAWQSVLCGRAIRRAALAELP